MTMFAIAAAVIAVAAMWVITAPRSPQDPTLDELSQLIAVGFIP